MCVYVCVSHTGVAQWPGASFVILPNGEKIYLKFGDRRKIANELKVRLRYTTHTHTHTHTHKNTNT